IGSQCDPRQRHGKAPRGDSGRPWVARQDQERRHHQGQETPRGLADHQEVTMGFERFDPVAFLAGLRENEKSELPPAKVAKAAKVGGGNDLTLASLATLAGPASQNEKSGRIHPRLRRALVRELWPTIDTRSFFLDISVISPTPVAEACPEGIDPQAWREAIEAAGHGMDAAARAFSAYPDEPIVLRFRWVPPLDPDDPQSVAQARQRFDAVVARWLRVTQ